VAHQLPTVDIDGLRVSYCDAGIGLPVVFLPGLTGSKEWFQYQLSGLSESYRVLSYDFRLAGRQRYSAELLAEDLAKFLSALRIHSAVIAGHSFGGLVAQQFAISYPYRVKSLLLVSTFPYLEEKSPAALLEWLVPGEVKLQSPIRDLILRLFCRWCRQRSEREHYTLAGPGKDSPDDGGWGKIPQTNPDRQEDLKFLAAHTAGLNKYTLNARLRIIQDFDSRERLAGFSMPALIVAGASDRPEILKGAQLLYEGIPDATLEVIEGAGHFCFYERHDLFNEIVDQYLSERLASLS